MPVKFQRSLRWNGHEIALICDEASGHAVAIALFRDMSLGLAEVRVRGLCIENALGLMCGGLRVHLRAWRVENGLGEGWEDDDIDTLLAQIATVE